MNLALSEQEILACHPVMRELRPAVGADQFLEYVRTQKDYRLAFVMDAGSVIAVAGFRISENLAWGRYLYIEDMVTLASHRSRGHGADLLAWLSAYAAKEGCAQLHLDSGMQRAEAHRFYERAGIAKTGFHFATGIVPDETANHR